MLSLGTTGNVSLKSSKLLPQSSLMRLSYLSYIQNAALEVVQSSFIMLAILLMLTSIPSGGRERG